MLARTWKTGEATSALGLSHEALLELRASHKDGEEFIRALISEDSTVNLCRRN